MGESKKQETSKGQKSIFIRQSSGLVREVSPWSSFFATFGLVTGGVPILIVSWLYLAPGANWPLGYLITLLPVLGMAFLFYVASITTARSGGDYVFNARASYHPIIGFVNYWALWVAFALSLGLYGYLGAQWFGYLFTGLGLFYNSSTLLNLGTLFTTTLGSIIVGVILMIIVTVVATVGRYGWKFILITGIISIVATVITFVAFSTIRSTQFYTALSSFTGVSNAYESVISSATSNGLTFVSPTTGALMAIPAIWYYFSWYNLPVSWSGEMKKVKFNSMISIIVAILFIASYYTIYTQLIVNAFGEKFLTAFSYISANSIQNPVFNQLSSIGAFPPFFALLVYHNPLLFIIMWIAFWLPNFYSLSPLVIALTRYLFAWSFDRIMPERLANVSERFHVPLEATMVAVGVGIIGIFLYAYVTAISIVDITVVFEISYAIFALTTALTPFIKKDFFQKIPIKAKIGNIPLISLVGFLVFGFLVYSIHLNWGNPVLLPINFPTLLSLGLIYGSGVIIYLTSYFINARNGIQMDLVFKEIPPE